ncbi:hypothetical protein LX15_001187 [Streptoalloteichus tenebrarius]|uniref:CU044_5270 family protein n=1 Tax=Streptoalloteichus tenebrarius (strain ATCC 17920 / DSM 40477 / JCM 4838 / CBS 697.72 / NBRC 16177 / NCIMB 11028 / NRRL B-12390 / A12253. 1 / ISP 5477) TaxID=1933 RepID=A0ABT1HPR0_STRSD|nr:CU044_5270 family protein [Streptoalloteichus tenebrarius]MCP2257502.1 hypothetical protein [Streptoalloteichus tenebrarius]BFE98452.1 hypothetical protein GCM10020241_01280 [Streptoalloteichus tenebrarius]
MPERTTSEERVDQRVRALLADVPPMTEQSFVEGRQRVLAGAAEGARPVAARPLAGRRGAARWLALAAGVVVLAAGAVVGVSALGPDHQPTASAATVLNRAAALAITVEDPVVNPGQYHYTKTHQWALGVEAAKDRNGRAFQYLSETVSEVWRPTTWTDQWLARSTTTGRRQWIEGSEEEARAAGVPLDDAKTTENRAPCGDFIPELGTTGPCQLVQGSWNYPTPEFMAGLPRDPRQLHDRIKSYVDGQKDLRGGVITVVSRMLSAGWTPKDLRAALYRVLADLPDIQIMEHKANLDGRTGVAFSAGDTGSTRWEIIIDPDTGRFIGEREVATSDWEDVRAGTLWTSSSVVTGVADGMGQPPRG